MATYGYHTGHTYEFIRPHICTQHVQLLYVDTTEKNEK